MPPKTTTAAPTNAVADALDAINDLASKAELYASHDQAGVLRVKIQALVAQAKAAL
ncbi:hypothetical protein [Paraburkholderia panacisoli]|uniref:hypothetical protein n=1 Tax=Paraburkholderia panacisoli TaxID=2603818 RepID=UPI00165F7068|nr:hypothetical protein [Paraburkholderia panacisoli]